MRLAIFAVLLLFANLQAQTPLVSQLKTFGTVGKGRAVLSANKETEIFSHRGTGCLTHMWFGGDFKNDGRTRIRIYVDGESTASIDMELFLGTGIGFQDDASPWGTEKMGKTGGGDTIYNTFRIPFGQSVRVTAQLPPDSDPAPPFWWIIRGTENLPVQLGGVTLPATARLKLYKTENYDAKPLEEVKMCDVPGAGALFLTTIQAKGDVHQTNDWRDMSFMEGCVRAYLNGGKDLLMLSSGFEDYFVGTYYFNRGKYATALAGVTHLDAKALEVSAYRFHDADPVFFQNGLKLTVRCGDTEDASMNGKVVGNPPPATYTTYTWVYQW
jgi:hypothetical protein